MNQENTEEEEDDRLRDRERGGRRRAVGRVGRRRQEEAVGEVGSGGKRGRWGEVARCAERRGGSGERGEVGKGAVGRGGERWGEERGQRGEGGGGERGRWGEGMVGRGAGGCSKPTCAAMHAVSSAAMARHITGGVEEGCKVGCLAQRLSRAGATHWRIKGPLIQYVHKVCIHHWALSRGRPRWGGGVGEMGQAAYQARVHLLLSISKSTGLTFWMDPA